MFAIRSSIKMESLFPQSSVWLIVLGSLISIIGLLAVILALFKKKRRDMPLAAFGVASLLYGAREIIEIYIQQFVSFPPPQALIYIIACLTYIMPIPLSGFLYLFFGRGWKNSMLLVFWATIVLACVEMLSDFLLAKPFSLQILNNILVIIWALLLIINSLLAGLKKTKELRIVLGGFAVFGIFALNANLVSLNLLPWEWEEEWYGFLIFLISLGYVAASRFFSNETRLKTMEHELEIAREIQSSILPHNLPVIQGLDMAARYVPMSAVAGDFYDVQVQDSTHLCAIVADVSGHGVGAALIASMLKIAFSSQHENLTDPARVLIGMNQSLHLKLDNNFVTAACVYIDLEEGFLRYAAAGHPPLLLFRKKDRKILEFGDNGLILGPFPDTSFPLTTQPFLSGDRIIMYTDGITETRNANGEFFGDRIFKEFIKDQGTLPAESFAEALLERVAFWSERSAPKTLEDDLTLMILDRK